jgi:parallel beta-helix repeat protein
MRRVTISILIAFLLFSAVMCHFPVENKQQETIDTIVPVTRGPSVNITPENDTVIMRFVGQHRSNSIGNYIFAGRNAGFGAKRTLMRFNVSNAIPPGATITSVNLTLYMSRARPLLGIPSYVALHRMNRDWGEGTSLGAAQRLEEGFGDWPSPTCASWTRPFNGTPTTWTNQGADGDYTTPASANITVGITLAFYTWPSTPTMVSDVQSWLDDPSQNFGWILKGEESVASTAKRFGSRDNPTINHRPHLQIDFSPVFHAHNMDLSTDHWTIQDAVDNANPGNRIKMVTNFFDEDVTVDKNLFFMDSNFTLAGNISVTNNAQLAFSNVSIDMENMDISAGAKVVLKKGQGWYSTHQINVDGTLDLQGADLRINNSVEGTHGITVTTTGELLTQLDSTTHSVISSSTGLGYFIDAASGAKVRIENTTIRDAGWDDPNPGLVVATDDVYIANAVLEQNHFGVNGLNNKVAIVDTLIQDNTKIGAVVGPGSVVETTKIFNNGATGLTVHGDGSRFLTNNITQNTGNGIEFIASSLNIVRNNDIDSNTGKGVSLDASSDDNLIYHNNFISNGVQALDSGSNTWNLTMPLGGNYWDDYTGVDLDGDGLGDTLIPHLGYDPQPFTSRSGWLSNRAPWINNTDVLTVFEDQEYSVQYYAFDPEDDPFAWSLTTNASFLSISSVTGLLKGTPAKPDVGTAWVNVTVTDTSSNKGFHNFTLTVIPVNHPPERNVTTFKVTFDEDVGTLVDLNELFIDIDEDVLVYTVTGMENITVEIFENGTAQFGNVPDWSGDENLVVSANDTEFEVGLEIDVEVTQVNDPPVILELNAEEEYVQGGAQIVNATATDPDFYWGETLYFTWTSNVTGTIGTEDEINLSLGAGLHTVTLNVSDRAGAFTTQTFEVNIKPPAASDDDDVDDDVIDPTDTDEDGLPDEWELEHFDDLDQDAEDDYDGDGISNLDEYEDGTDPTVKNDPVVDDDDNGGSNMLLYGLIAGLVLVVLIIVVIIIIIIVMLKKKKKEEGPLEPGVPGAAAGPVRCYCGTEIPPGEAYCPMCGNEAPQPVAPAAAGPQPPAAPGPAEYQQYDQQQPAYGSPPEAGAYPPGAVEPGGYPSQQQQPYQQPAYDQYQQQQPMAQQDEFFTPDEFDAPQGAQDGGYPQSQEYYPPEQTEPGAQNIPATDYDDDQVY